MQTLTENKNNSQEKSSCLSQRELLHYASDKLSEKEKKKVEMHLIGCESCIALYQEVLNKKELAERTGKYADLFPEEDKKSFKIDFISKKQFFSAIAILLCVVVLLRGYSKYSKHSVKTEHAYSPLAESQKTTTEPQINEEPVSSEPVVTEKKHDLPPLVKKVSNDPPVENKVLKETKTTEKKPEETKAIIPKPRSVEPQKPIEKTTAPLAKTILKTPVLVKDTFEKIPAPPVTAFIKNYKIAKSPDEPTGGNYVKGLETILKQIDQAQYKDALTEAGKFLNDYPGDVNGKYYRGYIFYQMINNDQAVSEMDWIINKHDKFFYDDARWYKALILNRTQKPAEAKNILNDLVSTNSSYAAKAKQLMDLMEGK